MKLSISEYDGNSMTNYRPTVQQCPFPPTQTISLATFKRNINLYLCTNKKQDLRHSQTQHKYKMCKT